MRFNPLQLTGLCSRCLSGPAEPVRRHSPEALQAEAGFLLASAAASGTGHVLLRPGDRVASMQIQCVPKVKFAVLIFVLVVECACNTTYMAVRMWR